MKVDLDWEDGHAVPDKAYPDLVFLEQKVNAAILKELESSKGESILDIGCGRAGDMVTLSRKGGRSIGLEPSRKMLEFARECLAESKAEVALVQAIAEYLPFKTGSVDSILCKGALDHFAYPDKAVEEMSRVLKPQGKAVILIANSNSPTFMVRRTLHWFRRTLKREKQTWEAWGIPSDHTCTFDYSRLKRLVAPHLHTKRSRGFCYFYGSRGWGPALARLPKGFSYAILETLDKLACRLPALNGVILLCCTPRDRD